MGLEGYIVGQRKFKFSQIRRRTEDLNVLYLEGASVIIGKYTSPIRLKVIMFISPYFKGSLRY